MVRPMRAPPISATENPDMWNMGDTADAHCSSNRSAAAAAIALEAGLAGSTPTALLQRGLHHHVDVGPVG